MFVRVVPETLQIGAVGGEGPGAEIHLPHPLAEFRWLPILQ
jgi:hypothetical protein